MQGTKLFLDCLRLCTCIDTDPFGMLSGRRDALIPNRWLSVRAWRGVQPHGTKSKLIFAASGYFRLISNGSAIVRISGN